MSTKNTSEHTEAKKANILSAISIPYLLLGIAYIAYYFTHVAELYIAIGLIYLYLGFKH